MKKILFATALLMFAWPASASATENLNGTDYWGAQPGVSQCFKAEASTEYGAVAGTTVTLGVGGWEILVVKGGDDRTVVYSPEAGVAYQAPLNNGGNVPDVSHWIVCSSTTPDEPPALTGPCPEGTVPGWLNENGEPTSCVSNDPCPGQIVVDGMCIDETPPAVTPEPTYAPEPEPELAETGFDEWFLGLMATAFVALGAFLVWGARR